MSDFGPTLEATLNNVLRGHAESRMTSRCTVWRSTNRRVQDDDTDYEGWEYAARHRDLPFRLKPGASENVTVGDVEQQRGLAQCHFPAETADLRDGDLVEITVGPSAGLWYRVTDSTPADGRTARRVDVKNVDRPDDFVEVAL